MFLLFLFCTVLKKNYNAIEFTISNILFLAVNSTVSSASTRYDPDLLRSEVMMAKERVMRLRGEMEQVECEVASKQRGLSTLAQ